MIHTRKAYMCCSMVALVMNTVYLQRFVLYLAYVVPRPNIALAQLTFIYAMWNQRVIKSSMIISDRIRLVFTLTRIHKS